MLGRHSIVNAEQEDELVGRILDMESRPYGLSVIVLKMSEKLCTLFARKITYLASAITSRWLDVNG